MKKKHYQKISRHNNFTYYINIYGTVWKTDLSGRSIFLKSSAAYANTYKAINLPINNKIKRINIHRLLARFFIPNPFNKPIVNHIDGNKWNNNLNNLEWVTGQENMQHAYKSGLR